MHFNTAYESDKNDKYLNLTIFDENYFRFLKIYNEFNNLYEPAYIRKKNFFRKIEVEYNSDDNSFLFFKKINPTPSKLRNSFLNKPSTPHFNHSIENQKIIDYYRNDILSKSQKQIYTIESHPSIYIKTILALLIENPYFF